MNVINWIKNKLRRETKATEDDKTSAKSVQEQPVDNGGISILRMGVIFLALVSFFTTANGMHRYIFTNDLSVAYMSSGAIQLILLALSLNFLGFLQNIINRKWHWFWRVLIGVFYVLLAGVSLFLSSWFSYIYIADVLHADSWDVESELLVQQTYREELYGAQDYAAAYQAYLEERLGDDIAELAVRASELSDTSQGLLADWNTEKAVYVGSDSAAVRYVSTVLTTMDRAMVSNATQESRDLAVVAISDAVQSIEDRIETLQGSAQRQQEIVDNSNIQIQNLTNRLNNATEGTNIEILTNSLNTYTIRLDTATRQLFALEQEHVELEDALDWLSRCSNLLGMNDSTSATSIRSKLIQLQTEFYNQNPDVDTLIEIATGVFEDLQRATSSLMSGTGANTNQYVDLMQQMNRLIQNLRDYSNVKAIKSELDQMVVDSSLINMANISAANDSDAPNDTPDADTPDADAPDADALNGDTPDGNSNANTEEQKGDENDEQKPVWREVWKGRLETLKDLIGAMPVYMETSGAAASTGILSETQRNILNEYDRSRSSGALDDMLRYYITSHSAVYQGIIYLRSSYRGLAIFALILAFSFDLSGFVFSFVIPAPPAKKESTQEEIDSKERPLTNYMGTRSTERRGWGVVKTAVSYRVLTGDFESEDGIFYYKTFKDGILSKWKVEVPNMYPAGIYVESTQDGGKTGTILPDGEQELEFTNAKRIKNDGSVEYSSGQDGIYRDCGILYKEGGLFRLVQNQLPENKGEEISEHIHKENQYTEVFIASVNEYMPVHIYDSRKGESLTLPARNLAKKTIQAKVMAVALNDKKTCVAAVYVLQ